MLEDNVLFWSLTFFLLTNPQVSALKECQRREETVGDPVNTCKLGTFSSSETSRGASVEQSGG